MMKWAAVWSLASRPALMKEMSLMGTWLAQQRTALQRLCLTRPSQPHQPSLQHAWPLQVPPGSRAHHCHHLERPLTSVLGMRQVLLLAVGLLHNIGLLLMALATARALQTPCLSSLRKVPRVTRIAEPISAQLNVARPADTSKL